MSPIIPIFTPQNWYWTVAGSATQVYSSAIGDYVPVGNATYQAWLVGGNQPTRIDSEKSLGEVLARYIDILLVLTSTVLAIQQALKQAQLDAILGADVDIIVMVQNGSVTTLTGTQVATFLANSTNNYRSLRAQIAAATTAAQVQAININAGWPANP